MYKGYKCHNVTRSFSYYNSNAYETKFKYRTKLSMWRKTKKKKYPPQ